MSKHYCVDNIWNGGQMIIRFSMNNFSIKLVVFYIMTIHNKYTAHKIECDQEFIQLPQLRCKFTIVQNVSKHVF